MRIALIDVDGHNFPNLPLMKLSAWHKNQGYTVDWYASKAYNFGLFSFDRGNILVGRDVFDKLEELIKTLHRVEWWAVGGNPACRGYDSFIERHNGTKHVLKDSIKDKSGEYHDDIIYEIVSEE